MVLGLVEKARQFAQDAHAGQTYGDRYPYMKHLDDVVEQLRQYGLGDDEELLAAGFLHDVLEDTLTAGEELESGFGVGVTELVRLVTDKGGATRQDRHSATYPKIRGNRRATALKLADRLANVHACRESGDRRLWMYRGEQADFERLLYVEGDGNGAMWEDLRQALASEKAIRP